MSEIMGTSVNDVTLEGEREGPRLVWRCMTYGVGEGKVLWRHARYTGIATAGMHYIRWDHVGL